VKRADDTGACGHCGALIYADTKECPQCGRFPVKLHKCPRCRTIAAETGERCPRCGRMFEPGGDYL
jgi:RNA polymerase subunit RPABC4/transcription elongation factor Spt4